MVHKSLDVIFLFLLYGFVLGLNAGCAVYHISPSDDKEPVHVRDELLAKAQKYIWERCYNKALGLLDEAERIEGVSTETELMRGRIFYTLECWSKARIAFNAVLMHQPGNHHAVVYLWYMDAIEKEGFHKEALKHFRAASELKDSGDSIKGMERILKKRGIAEAPADYFSRIEGVFRFTDVTEEAGLHVSKGKRVAWSDIDKDGDMDLLVCAGKTLRLLRNETQEFQRSWLEVRVSGNKSPGTGIGTKVMVQTMDGSGLWLREIQAGRGTGNQDQALTHFGFGENKGPFKVTVQFPSGTDVVLDEIQCCNIIEVEEP